MFGCGVAEVLDGVQVYRSEDVMAQGLYYPENRIEGDERLPFVVIPPGADPFPAVLRIKARMQREEVMMLSDLISQLQEVLAAHGDIKVFTGDMQQIALEVSEPGAEPDDEDDPLRGQTYLCLGAKR